MLIRCCGHAKFLIETADGYRIVTDPFDASVGYPVTDLQADAVLVSHHHHDHDAVDTVRGWTKMVDSAGTHTLTPGVTVRALEAYHDDQQGAKRGKNLLMCIEADGLRLVHLGDLGHQPDSRLLSAIGSVDILMIPVGGFFTIDAEQAAILCRQLQPKVILPMHYRTAVNADWPIAPVDEFLSRMASAPVETLTVLRVTKEDLGCQPSIALLQPEG
ncbi:MAG: MBL fold metallo-hydrolase [Clostridia bacterium]|nr:MBL fold metallo-hydrolase [Clostridia bacterium]